MLLFCFHFANFVRIMHKRLKLNKDFLRECQWVCVCNTVLIFALWEETINIKLK
jgi:succinate dehydrogenase/fumarate reductase cytochrome b subunit